MGRARGELRQRVEPLTAAPLTLGLHARAIDVAERVEPLGGTLPGLLVLPGTLLRGLLRAGEMALRAPRTGSRAARAAAQAGPRRAWHPRPRGASGSATGRPGPTAGRGDPRSGSAAGRARRPATRACGRPRPAPAGSTPRCAAERPETARRDRRAARPRRPRPPDIPSARPARAEIGRVGPQQGARRGGARRRQREQDGQLRGCHRPQRPVSEGMNQAQARQHAGLVPAVLDGGPFGDPTDRDRVPPEPVQRGQSVARRRGPPGPGATTPSGPCRSTAPESCARAHPGSSRMRIARGSSWAWSPRYWYVVPGSSGATGSVRGTRA